MYCLLTLVWHYVAILSISATILHQDHNIGQQNQCFIVYSMGPLTPNFSGYSLSTKEFKW